MPYFTFYYFLKGKNTARVDKKLHNLNNTVSKLVCQARFGRFFTRFNACDMLSKRNEYDPFFKQTVAEDKKFIAYNYMN